MRFLIFLVFSCSLLVAKENDNSIKIEVADDIYSVSEKNKEQYKAAMSYLNSNVINPISPQDKKKMIENRRYENALLSAIPKPKSFSSNIVYTSLQPGTESIKVDIVAGLPVTIIFKNQKGEPINVYGSEVQGLPFRVDKVGGGSNSTSDKGKVIRPDNIIMLQTDKMFGGANLPIFTTFADLPVAFDVTVKNKPGDKYIDRLIVILGNAQDVSDSISSMTKLNSRDKLMRVLNSLPPTDKSEKILFGNMVAWRDGDSLWIRTTKSILYPLPDPDISTELNGVKVYKIKYAPVLTIGEGNNQFTQLRRVL